MGRDTTSESATSGRRAWSAPELERLDVAATESGVSPADEELIPATNPPS